MENEIKQLDKDLTEILKRSTFVGLTQDLVETYSMDELHIMSRLLRQKGKYGLHAHLLAILNLAEKTRKFL
jgi:hypothetical protein